MKLLVISPDASGTIDGTLHYHVLAHLPTTEGMAACDAVVVPIAYHGDYRFNPGLLAIKKPVILLDYLEMGWDAGDKENVLGRGALKQFGHLASEEWSKLDAWVRDHPPVLTLKRELHQRDVSYTIQPAEFPCLRPLPPLQSKAEYDARPIEVFFSWGLSHPSRQRLHGDIFRNAHDSGIHVVDGWHQDGHFEKRTWATIHSPWYARQPIDVVDTWNSRAKISVSLPGAGQKCFRSAEAPRGSIMALQDDMMAWSYPWENYKNALWLVPGSEFKNLTLVTDRADLYDIYANSQQTCAKYFAPTYARDYLAPTISSRL